MLDDSREEYESDAFRAFAQSALIQYANLPIYTDDKESYHVEAYDDTDFFERNYSESCDPVLTVECYQINKTDMPIKIKVPPLRGEVSFEPGDRIRLYKSRKWTKQSLLKLASSHRFEVLKGLDEENKELEYLPEPVLEPNGTGFMTVFLRKQTE